MFKKISVLLEMIKFKHTVFALPFAFMGAFLAADGLPPYNIFGWIILAMAGARTSAMGFNRIVDRHFDLKNPRTAGRALPSGEVKLWEAWLRSGGTLEEWNMRLKDLPELEVIEEN